MKNLPTRLKFDEVKLSEQTGTLRQADGLPATDIIAKTYFFFKESDLKNINLSTIKLYDSLSHNVQIIIIN